MQPNLADRATGTAHKLSELMADIEEALAAHGLHALMRLAEVTGHCPTRAWATKAGMYQDQLREAGFGATAGLLDYRYPTAAGYIHAVRR